MKMISLILIVLCCWSASGHAQGVGELLDEAIAAPPGPSPVLDLNPATRLIELQPSSYVKARERIVSLGQSAVPELQAIMAQPNATWQRRVMAGICLERIQRGAELNAFLNYRWKSDPELKKANGWQSLGDYPDELFTVAEKRWRETGLTYHLLQEAWKRTREFPVVGRHHWRTWALEILKTNGNPELVYIARDKLASVQDPSEILFDDANWFCIYLVERRDHESFRIMFTLWQEYWRTNWTTVFNQIRDHTDLERSTRFTHDRMDSQLNLLLAIATAEDAGWIQEKLQNTTLGTEGKQSLAAYLNRVQDGMPPVITVLGANPATIECGGAYADAGATAKDDKDGDITSRIIVENNVERTK